MLRDGTRFLAQAFRQYHYFSLRNQREGLRVTSVPLEIFFRKDLIETKRFFTKVKSYI